MPARSSLYCGVRLLASATGPHHAETCLVSVDGSPLQPTKRAEQLAPRGYDWGTPSLGTDALAHAMLAREFGNQFADAHYEAFARDMLYSLPRGQGGEAWRLTSADIQAWQARQRGAAGDTVPGEPG
jgi:hypothetical protein